MSFILDALSRADRERDAQQQVPTLKSGRSPASTAVPGHAGARRWHLERWLLVAVLTGLLLLEVYDRTRPTEPVAESASVAADPGSPPRSSMPQPQPAIVPLPARQKVEPSLPERKTVAAAASPASPASRQAISSLYDAPPDDTDEAVVADSEKNGKPAAEVSAEAPEPLASLDNSGFGDVPYITELPQALRKQIPTLDYAEHFPSTEPGVARVMVNGALRGEGQQIAPDLVLVAIEDDGIVMSFRGTDFRLPALNRWVNF